jgi:hypothetical protein
MAACCMHVHLMLLPLKSCASAPGPNARMLMHVHTHTHTHTHVSNMLFDSSLSNMHVHTNAHTCTHTHTHVSNPKSKSTARACFSPEGVRNPNEGCVHGSAQCAHLTGVRRNARISGKRVQAGRQASEFRVVLAGQQFGANWSC